MLHSEVSDILIPDLCYRVHQQVGVYLIAHIEADDC